MVTRSWRAEANLHPPCNHGSRQCIRKPGEIHLTETVHIKDMLHVELQTDFALHDPRQQRDKRYPAKNERKFNTVYYIGWGSRHIR